MLKRTKDKQPQPQGADRYYEDARDWDYDRYGRMKSSRDRAWLVAGASATIACLSLAAVLVMLPLKTFEPYVITVDQATGAVEMTRGLQDGDLTQDEAITKSFLVRYVVGRESYNAATTTDNYEKITLWSEGEALNRYQSLYARGNPNNPVKQYGTDTQVRIRIKNVLFLNDRTAAVPFIRTESRRGIESETHWVATLTYRYVAKPSKEKDRFINPLGFQIATYRTDQETLGE